MKTIALFVLFAVPAFALELECVEAEPQGAHAATVRIGKEPAGELFAEYDLGSAVERVSVESFELNGPEVWYQGQKGFTLRYDPTVDEGTLLETPEYNQVELRCRRP